MVFDINSIKIPEHPGIYLMRDDSQQIIYIGKAKNLRKRVRTYFTKNQNYKTQKLVSKISNIEFVLTDNENEAFLLESNMIKRYRPTYNIELKDQQRYTYLRLTDEKYPRLTVARRMRTGKFIGKGKIFGPFTHGSSKLLTIGSLRKSFKIRICKTLPKKVCLEYHLGNCDAPCVYTDAQKEYPIHVSNLEDVLKNKGDMKIFVKKLKEQMIDASNKLRFEEAKEIRDTLQRLGSLRNSQKMEYVKGADEEFFGIVSSKFCATVMTFKQMDGVIKDSEKFSFDLVGDNTFSNFIYQYYTTRRIPQMIVVNELPQEHKLLEKLLTKRSNKQVKIMLPNKGRRSELIKLILKNLRLIHENLDEPSLFRLKTILSLSKVPKTIECFDISNHGEEYAVGAMSQFVDARPNKTGYRRFKIKTVSGRDDFAMINEIVKRRYIKLKKDGIFPDLILIDGGKGQLSAATDALKNINVKIPCISLAKENEEVHITKFPEPIIMEKSDAALQVLQFARDEAHRFGVAYNRTLRKIK